MKIREKKILFLLCLFGILIYSCKQNEKVVKADLSFRSVIFTSAYGASEEEYENFINNIKTTVTGYNSFNEKKSAKHQNYLLSKHILRLHDLGLFKLPLIFLHFDNDSIMEVYISEKEYEKLKHFNQVDLYNEKKKVIINLCIQKKDSGVYYSDKILNIEKVEGRSRSNIK